MYGWRETSKFSALKTDGYYKDLAEPERMLAQQQAVLEGLKLEGAGEEVMVVERRKLWRLRMRVGNCRRIQRLQGLANKTSRTEIACKYLRPRWRGGGGPDKVARPGIQSLSAKI